MTNEPMFDEMPAPTLPWTKIGSTAQPFTIASIAMVPGKFGKRDAALTLADDQKNLTRFDAWGQNYTYLYNTLGHRPSDWIGKKIFLQLVVEGGKNKRVVTV